jgi:RHS repeat-associated protein
MTKLDGLVDNRVMRKFTWGLDLSGSLEGAGGIGGLQAIEDLDDPNDANDLHGQFVACYDGLGNLTQLIDWESAMTAGSFDASTHIAAHYEYSPYGQVVRQTGSYAAENPFRFSTKWFDGETGLGNWGRRYLILEQGRWLNRDPIEESGGHNLYAFAHNAPVVYSDTLGREATVYPDYGLLIPGLPTLPTVPCDEIGEYPRLSLVWGLGCDQCGWKLKHFRRAWKDYQSSCEHLYKALKCLSCGFKKKARPDRRGYEQVYWDQVFRGRYVLSIILKKAIDTGCRKKMRLICKCNCVGDTVAWTHKSGHWTGYERIYLCPAWRDTDSRHNTTILHELTHIGGSEDSGKDYQNAYQLEGIIPWLAKWCGE